MRIGLETFSAKQVVGKHVGIVTNQSGLNSKFKSTAEVLKQAGALIKVLFGPEHGYSGVEQAGVNVTGTQVDPMLNVPVYSLYRPEEAQSFGPPVGSLDGLDLLVFDLQDVGVRFYTYLATLGYVLEAAAAADLPVLVLDRPNPIGGLEIEGPLLQPGFESFVGRYPVTIRHGLTMGEAAQLISGQYLNDKVRLEIALLEGWDRRMRYQDTGLAWIATSPNLPTTQVTLIYPGLCLIEGTNLSTGRGTTQPFEIVGSPWLDNTRLAAELNGRWQDKGFYIRPTMFKPMFERYAGEVCRGVQIHLIPTNPLARNVVKLGLDVVATTLKQNPDSFQWREAHFDRLIGTDTVRQQLTLDAGHFECLENIYQKWQNDETEFEKLRKNYLLYQ